MKPHVRRGITEFITATIAVCAAIFLMERFAWQQINRLREEASPKSVQKFRSADRIRALILELSRGWNPASSNKLQTSLAQQLANAQSPKEKVLLEQLASSFQVYGNLASPFPASSNPAPATAESEGRREKEFQRLLELSEELTAANEAGMERLFETISSRLLRLQRFLFAALLGLLVCGAVVLGLTYRRIVEPLRSSLAESRVLMERQEKLASLGVFATGIAHEIRNPLTAVKVRLFTLKGSHRPDSEEFEDLEVIESEINRLERIVQEFLRFARPAEPDLLLIEIDTFLREVHGLLLPDLTKRGVRFELDLQAGEQVRIDPEKMKQVLMNFVQNAADSIQGDGTVTLSSRTDHQSIGGRFLAAVAVAISDTGKGMPPEVQKRLFDPFFTTKEQGTGLGLPIAARIVEKHGGLIQYRTEPDRGTTFTILLPRANA